MNYKAGTKIPTTGVYWCTVCKLPKRLTEGEDFPTCKNMCGRGNWHFVQVEETPQPPTA